MAEDSTASDDQRSPEASDESSARKVVAPKRLPWVWTVLLLLVLPATALGLWYGGTRHRVDDYPKKVKPHPKRLVPKDRKPRVRPVARPAARPVARPAARPAVQLMARPAVQPMATEGATK